MDPADVEAFVDQKMKTAITSNSAELLSSLGEMLNNKISGGTNNFTVSSVMEAPKFKRRSNEDQYKVNAKVLNKLEEADASLVSQNILEAKQSLIEAKDLVKRRQKLVQLADSSELGWRVVAEYESNPIASDSEDEKRIYKAEVQASRKAKSDKTNKRQQRPTPYTRTRPRFEPSPAVQQGTSFMGQRQRPGICFVCNKPGHWKSECLQRGSNVNNKISTHLVTYCQSETTVNTVNACFATDIKAPVSKPLVTEMTIVCTPDEGKMTEPRIGEAKNVSPVGRLKTAVSKWKEATDSSYMIDLIENGYRLPFKYFPAETHIRNNKSARENSDFVKLEIQALLEKGVVSEVVEKPKVVNPLTVAFNRSGKPRLVLDSRHVNPSLHLFKVKFEDIRVALDMFEPFSYIFTFDFRHCNRRSYIYQNLKVPREIVAKQG